MNDPLNFKVTKKVKWQKPYEADSILILTSKRKSLQLEVEKLAPSQKAKDLKDPFLSRTGPVLPWHFYP